jgi:hypothetical protein
MNTIQILLLSMITVEAVSELISASEIFNGFRMWLFKGGRLRRFFHDVADCTYCTSVWISFIIALFIHIDIVSVYIDWFIIWMVIHRGADVLNKVVYKIFG